MINKPAILFTLLLSSLAVLIPTDVFAQDTSTPQERTRWAEVTRKLEVSPLDAALNQQGDLAFKRMGDVHDFHALLCPALLHDFSMMKYDYSRTVTRQYILASGAFAIENPDKVADSRSINLSAVQSVLKMYQSILQQKPEAKSKLLEDFAKKQNQGKLEIAVENACP